MVQAEAVLNPWQSSSMRQRALVRATRSTSEVSGVGRTTSSRLVPWRRRALAQEPELRQHAPSPRMIVRPAGRTRTAKE